MFNKNCFIPEVTLQDFILAPARTISLAELHLGLNRLCKRPIRSTTLFSSYIEFSFLCIHKPHWASFGIFSKEQNMKQHLLPGWADFPVHGKACMRKVTSHFRGFIKLMKLSGDLDINNLFFLPKILYSNITTFLGNISHESPGALYSYIPSQWKWPGQLGITADC